MNTVNKTPCVEDDTAKNDNSESKPKRYDRAFGRILVAEDTLMTQKVILRHLQHTGFQVELVQDGSQAVNAYKEKPYDIIFMDMQMPVMDGHEAIKNIRELELQAETNNENDIGESFRRTPIVAITADTDAKDQQKCLLAGADDYLPKPLKQKMLLSALKKWTEFENGKCTKFEKESSLKTDSPTNISPPMDYDRALAEFEGDRRFLSDIINEFLVQTSVQIDILQQAIAVKDAGKIAKISHALKGGAANLIAADLSCKASELENAGRSGILEKCAPLLEQFTTEFARLKEYLKLMGAV